MPQQASLLKKLNHLLIIIPKGTKLPGRMPLGTNCLQTLAPFQYQNHLLLLHKSRLKHLPLP